MSPRLNDDADRDWYDDEFDYSAESDCTWCGGDGIGDGCPDPIQCCGRDYCHCCAGTGEREHQTVF